MVYATRESAMESVFRRSYWEPNTGCFLFSGPQTAFGYGKVALKRDGVRTSVMAHRLAFEAYHGRPPVGILLHSCDTRVCINDDHLREGTDQENSDDAKARGRLRRGRKPGHISPEVRRHVREAIAAGKSIGQTAILCGVDRSTARKYYQERFPVVVSNAERAAARAARAKEPKASRTVLGKTALRVLSALDEHGPIPLSHGYRYALVSRFACLVMSSTNHLLRAHGMVEWAGCNYGCSHVMITDYGLDCLKRKSRDLNRAAGSMIDTYGPREDRP